jgi:carbonic anhydrase
LVDVLFPRSAPLYSCTPTAPHPASPVRAPIWASRVSLTHHALFLPVVVVGHTSCGGCNAAFAAPAPVKDAEANADAGTSPNPLRSFLGPLIDIRHALPVDATVDDLVRENVLASVKNIVESGTMAAAWAKGKNVYVHGWVYDLKTGLLADLGFSQGPQ